MSGLRSTRRMPGSKNSAGVFGDMEHLGPKETHQARGRNRRSVANHHRRMIRVLIVDEDQDDVDRYLQEFRRAQLAVSVDVVQTPAQFLDRLQAQPWGVVLADTDIGGPAPLGALSLPGARGHGIPPLLVAQFPGTQNNRYDVGVGASD